MIYVSIPCIIYLSEKNVKIETKCKMYTIKIEFSLIEKVLAIKNEKDNQRVSGNRSQVLVCWCCCIFHLNLLLQN